MMESLMLGKVDNGMVVGVSYVVSEDARGTGCSIVGED